MSGKTMAGIIFVLFVVLAGLVGYQDDIRDKSFHNTVSAISRGTERIVIDKQKTRDIDKIYNIAIENKYVVTPISDKQILLERK